MTKKVDIITFQPRILNTSRYEDYKEGLIKEIQSKLNKGFEIKGVGCDDATCAIIFERNE